MIQFNNLNQQEPYLFLKLKYDEALNAGQKNIEAIAISSYNTHKHEVDSRFVNLKFITNDESLLFFTRGEKKEIACLFNLSKNPLNLQLNGYQEILNSPQQFANISNEDVSLGGNGFIFLRK